MSKTGKEIYRFGPFLLDPPERLLLRSGKPVDLAPRTFDLLVALVTRQGALAEKDALLQEIWPDTLVEEATPSRHVFTLRKALGDDDTADNYIRTVPKRGYRFGVAVTRDELESPPGQALVIEHQRAVEVTRE